MRTKALIFLIGIAIVAGTLLIFFTDKKSTGKTGFESPGSSESGLKKISKGLPDPEKIEEREIAITLIEESDEDENYMFRYINELQVDGDGNIFVIDSKRILRYDPGGNFLELIGTPGQGPGEYINPRNLFIDRHRLYINDAMGRKLIVYDLGEGKEKSNFIKNITLKSRITSAIFVDLVENIFGITSTFSESGGPARVLMKFYADGKKVVELREPMAYIHADVEMLNGSGVIAWLPHIYSAELLFEPLRPDRLCLAENLYYKIDVLDLTGKNLFTIQREQELPRITPAEINHLREIWGKEIFEQFVFPPTKPIIEKILNDEQGRIYIVHKPSVLEEKKPVRVDIYDYNGNYLYKTGFSRMPRLIRKGYYYIIDRKENDEVVIKKIKMAI